MFCSIPRGIYDEMSALISVVHARLSSLDTGMRGDMHGVLVTLVHILPVSMR